MEPVNAPAPEISLPEKTWHQLEALGHVSPDQPVLSEQEVKVLQAAAKADRRAAGCCLASTGLVTPIASAFGSGALLFSIKYISDPVWHWIMVGSGGSLLITGVVSNYIGTGVLPHHASEADNQRQDLLAKLRQRFRSLSVSLIRGGVTDAPRCMRVARQLDADKIEQSLRQSGLPDEEAATLVTSLVQARAWVVDVVTPTDQVLWDAANQFRFVRP